MGASCPHFNIFGCYKWGIMSIETITTLIIGTLLSAISYSLKRNITIQDEVINELKGKMCNVEKDLQEKIETLKMSYHMLDRELTRFEELENQFISLNETLTELLVEIKDIKENYNTVLRNIDKLSFELEKTKLLRGR